MLKLKLQYFGLLMQRDDSLEKTLMLGKIDGKMRGGWQRMRWLDSNTNSMDMNLSMLRKWWKTGKPGVLQYIGSQRVGQDLASEQHHWNGTVQFSRSFVSDSLRPHKSQHARPPYPSPTPRARSNSCLSNRWCHLAISSSVVPFSSCPQSLPASESTLHMRWPKYWSFSFSIIPSKEHQKWIKMKTQQPPNYGTL